MACVDRTSCEASCVAGKGEACTEAARRIDADPIGVEPAQLEAVLERGCELREHRSCRRLAELLTETGKSDAEDTPVRRLRARACELGDAVSCLNGIEKPEQAVSKPELFEHAAGLMQAQCDAGVPETCVVLGALALAVRGDRARWERLLERGTELFVESCRSGRGDACVQAADLLAQRDGPEAPLGELPRSLLEQGCRLEVPEACTTLALRSPQMSEPVRGAHLEKSCERGQEQACIALGHMRRGRGREGADAAYERAAKLAEAKCGLGKLRSCDLLADAALHAPVDDATRARFLTRLRGVCERPVAVTCAKLAEVLEALPAPHGDRAEAVRLRARACAEGYPMACPDPMAALGFAERLGVPLIDTRSGLAWAPDPVRDVSPTQAPSVCQLLPSDPRTPWRLPRRAELDTLLENGALRRFMKMSLPRSGVLYASERDESGRRFALNLFEARVSAEPNPEGYVLCVRRDAQSAGIKRARLRLSADASKLGFELRRADGRVSKKGAVESPEVPTNLRGLLNGVDAGGEVVVEVSEGVDWAIAARFISEAQRSGLRIVHVLVDADMR
jgi:TPR repeat protein